MPFAGRLGLPVSLRRTLVGSAIGSFALNASSKLLMLAASMLLTQLLGAAAYGVYATAMATMMVLLVLSGFGLPILVVRMVAAYEVRGEHALMRGLLPRANRVILGTGLAVGAVGAAGACAFAGSAAPAYFWAVALIPLLALSGLRSAALRGLHHVVLAQVPECLVMPGFFVLALAALHWVGAQIIDPAPEVAIASRWIATFLAFAVGTWLISHKMPKAVRASLPAYDTRTWARSAAPAWLLAGMAMLITQIDTLLLAALQGSESAGVYQAAARGAELVAFSLTVVNFALQPVISSLYASGELARLQRILTLAARAGLALALPVSLLFILYAEPLLGRLFGSEFSRGAVCLSILCAAQVVSAAIGSADHVLNMTGHERDSARALMTGTAVNVLLGAVLIPPWDIEGAALSSAISLVLVKALLAAKVRSRLGLWPTALGRREGRSYGRLSGV
jgi:O-antigen/teichoic acid export membrane protein